MSLVPAPRNQAPVVTPRSPLAPESLLEPPACLPSITPSVLMDAIAAAMVDTKRDEEQVGYSTSGKRWDRTIEFQYDGGMTSELVVSGDAEYGPITADVVRIILTVMSYWTEAGYPRVLPMTIKDIGDATGINRKRIGRLFNAAAALKITGKVRVPETGATVDVNAQPFSGATDEDGGRARITGIAVDERWRLDLEMGLQAFIDLEVVLQLRHPLALRLYLYLAAQCARGAGAHVRQSGDLVRPAIDDTAFKWHRWLTGYDLVADHNTSRFYDALEAAIAELQRYHIVGEQSGVSRTDGGRRGPLFTRVRVQFGAGIDVLSLLRASTMADSARDRLLLTHLVRLGITIPVARKLLAVGHEKVIRVLLQVYHRRDKLQMRGGPVGSAMVVDAITKDYTYASDTAAREWAWNLAHPAPALPAGASIGAPNEPGDEPAAEQKPLTLKDQLSALNRQRRVNQESHTCLAAWSLLNAEVDGDQLALTHPNAFDAQMSSASSQASDVAALWEMIAALGLPVTICNLRNDLGRVIRTLYVGQTVGPDHESIPSSELGCPSHEELPNMQAAEPRE